MNEFLGGKVDESRILTEAAVFADKCNIEDIQNDCPLYEIADQREFW